MRSENLSSVKSRALGSPLSPQPESRASPPAHGGALKSEHPDYRSSYSCAPQPEHGHPSVQTPKCRGSADSKTAARAQAHPGYARCAMRRFGMGHQQGNALEGGGATPVCNRPGTVVSGDRTAGFAGNALPRQHEAPAQAEAPPMSLGRCLRRGFWCSMADASESSVRRTCHMLSSLSGYGTTLVSPVIRCRGTQNGRCALLISPHYTPAGKPSRSPRPGCRLHPSTPTADPGSFPPRTRDGSRNHISKDGYGGIW